MKSDIFVKVVNGIPQNNLYLRGKISGIGENSTDDVYLQKGYYPLINEQPTFDSSTQYVDTNYFELSNNVVKNIFVIKSFTTEELQAQARDAMVRAIEKLIQDQVDTYNTANGVAFKDIDACAKYTTVPTYTHYQFCVDVIAWQTSVWEYARQVQVDVLAGNRTMPTIEELMAELPAYTGV